MSLSELSPDQNDSWKINVLINRAELNQDGKVSLFLEEFRGMADSYHHTMVLTRNRAAELLKILPDELTIQYLAWLKNKYCAISFTRTVVQLVDEIELQS